MSEMSIGLRDTVAASDLSTPRAGQHTVAASDPLAPRTGQDAFEFTRGSLIDRYVVLERLGAGGMSIVYAAYDPDLRRRVALKLLLDDPVDADQARLVREARAIARLSHPNVVTVFDVGTYEGRVYVTMEYIDGQTLRQWKAAAPRTWQEVVAVFMDAARGLSAAHAARLFHRDFKPESRSPLGHPHFSPSGRILKFRGVLRRGLWRVMPRCVAVLATGWQQRTTPALL